MKFRIPFFTQKADGNSNPDWPIEPDRFEKLYFEQIQQILEERCETVEEAESLSEGLADKVDLDKMATDIAEGFYLSLLRQGRVTLRGQRRDRKGFEKRHKKLWQPALDLFEMYLLGCFELGASINKYDRSNALEKSPHKFEVLIRLHARAIQTGNEVFTLLSAGFPDGAHARWRTAHELAVIAILISNNGEELAQRYLEFQIAEIDKAIREHETHEDRLHEKSHPESYKQEVRKMVRQLRDRYGDHFTGRNGWASEIASKKNPSLKELEELAGIDHLRPYYTMASDNVHAGPKGSLNRLGLGKREMVLLVGPSNFGLTDPAHGTAISLLQIMTGVLLFKPRLDSLVHGQVLTRFVDDIGQTFSEIEQHLGDQFDH